jgi:hypothetical protein
LPLQFSKYHFFGYHNSPPQAIENPIKIIKIFKVQLSLQQAKVKLHYFGKK